VGKKFKNLEGTGRDATSSCNSKHDWLGSFW
jgi:hypothetical protein